MPNNPNLRRKIEAIMQGDTAAGHGWLGAGLSMMAGLYGAGVRLRKAAYAGKWANADRLDCLVVSVGNLTLGGTGKTPVTIYLARLIQSYGYRVVVISRGYKGSAEATGGVASNGRDIVMPASACGDEAYMVARSLGTIPVMVGRDRYAAGQAAIKKFNPQVILLDDAFQHIRLERDIDLVLLDAEKPFGNGKLFPRGVLREDESALLRASAVIFTRSGQGKGAIVEKAGPSARGKPIFQCEHQAFIADMVKAAAGGGMNTRTTAGRPGMHILNGRRGYAFSGIARNERFRRTIEQAGVDVCGTSFFDDHHWYSPEELKAIIKAAIDSGADMLVTTEKDMVRIPRELSWPLDLVAVGVEIRFPDDAFDRYIRQELVRFQ